MPVSISFRAAVATREDESVAHPKPLPVGDEAELSEVHLQLLAGVRIVHSYSRLLALRATALDREASKRTRRNVDAQAGKQGVDLGDGNAVSPRS